MVKKLLFTALVLFSFGAFSNLSGEEKAFPDYSPSWTVHELAASVSVPVKQLSRNLGVNAGDVQGRTLSELGITQQDARNALASYREAESGLVSGIVLAGMIIVFASLVVVSFFISLFRHLHIFDKKQSVKTGIGTISSRGSMDGKALAAVITAIFLYEEEVDSENRLLLTWERVSARAWKIENNMPNALFFGARRGRK